MSSSEHYLAPVRCFFSEVQERILAYDGRRDLKFRLLGSIVGFLSSESETIATEQKDDSWLIVTLDDGTALIQIMVTNKMVTQLKIQEGSLIECIAVVRKPESYDLRLRQTCATVSLIGEQVAVINDANAETLRWMELCFKQSNEVDDTQWLGYPTRSIASEDLFRIIEYQCEFETEGSSVTKPKGVSTEQLSVCFNLSSEEVQKFLHELQVRFYIDSDSSNIFATLQTEGLIYKNIQGLYCKL